MEKYVPVVVIKEMSETDKILTALKNNGINTAEITFRTACAAEAIAYACKNYPDMSIGAGTVIKNLQKHIHDIGMSFFDLIKQHHRIRSAAYLFGELSCLVISDISGRSSDYA